MQQNLNQKVLIANLNTKLWCTMAMNGTHYKYSFNLEATILHFFLIIIWSWRVVSVALIPHLYMRLKKRGMPRVHTFSQNNKTKLKGIWKYNFVWIKPNNSHKLYSSEPWDIPANFLVRPSIPPVNKNRKLIFVLNLYKIFATWR